MHPFPHEYQVRAVSDGASTVRLASPGLPELETAAPPEFDGPGGYWSPETLLVAAVADCYVLSFRAVARASKLEWSELEVDVQGVLDRVEGVTRFTRLLVKPRLVIPAGVDPARARTALEKAERVCLVSNSLSAEVALEPVVCEARSDCCA